MDKQIRIKKIIYRAVHRGCKETDYLLGNFFEASRDNIAELGLDICENLLAEDDVMIYDWIINKEVTPVNYVDIIKKIQKFHGF